MDTMGNELLHGDLNLDLALGLVVKDITTKEDMTRWLMQLHKTLRHGNIQKLKSLVVEAHQMINMDLLEPLEPVLPTYMATPVCNPCDEV